MTMPGLERSLERGAVLDIATKDDVRDVRDLLLKQLQEGFAGVHKRQDLTNGRIATNEGLTREHGVKLKNLEREVFHRRRGAPAAAAAEQRGDVGDKRITERDVRMFVAGVGALAAAAAFIWKLLPILLKAIA